MKKRTTLVALVLSLVLILCSVETSFAAFVDTGLETIPRTNTESNELAVEKIAMALQEDTANGKYKLVDTETLKEWMDAGDDMVILDTMPESWFNARHIPGAINAFAPLKGEEFTKAQKAEILSQAKAACTVRKAYKKNGKTKYKTYVNKNKRIVVYCGFVKCTRSHVAAKYLRSQGFKNVYRQPGGISTWVDSEYPVDGTDYNYVDRKTLHDNKDDYVILDVRKAADYKELHIDGAIAASIQDPDNITEPESEAIEAIIEEHGEDANYVLVCYSGNKFAKAATAELRELGVNNTNIYTLQKGFNQYKVGYPSDCVRQFGGATVNPAKKTVTFEATVSGKYLTSEKKAISHLILYGYGTTDRSADAPFLSVSTAPMDLHAALSSLGATPWSDSQRELATGQTLNDVAGDNAKFSHMTVTVDGKNITDVISYTKDGTPQSTTPIDMAFSGNAVNQKAWNTGCVACAFSCYAGVTSNAAIGIGTVDKEHNYFYLADDCRLKAGQTVKIVYRLK